MARDGLRLMPLARVCTFWCATLREVAARGQVLTQSEKALPLPLQRDEMNRVACPRPGHAVQLQEGIAFSTGFRVCIYSQDSVCLRQLDRPLNPTGMVLTSRDTEGGDHLFVASGFNTVSRINLRTGVVIDTIGSEGSGGVGVGQFSCPQVVTTCACHVRVT